MLICLNIIQNLDAPYSQLIQNGTMEESMDIVNTTKDKGQRKGPTEHHNAFSIIWVMCSAILTQIWVLCPDAYGDLHLTNWWPWNTSGG